MVVTRATGVQNWLLVITHGVGIVDKYTHWVYRRMMVARVRITARAVKDLRRVPAHVVTKLRGWVDAVHARGIEEVRKVPGYHDEPLKGRRRGQRSIRLSKAYRAVYQLRTDEHGAYISLEEVTKHEY